MGTLRFGKNWKTGGLQQSILKNHYGSVISIIWYLGEREKKYIYIYKPAMQTAFTKEG